MPPSDLTGCLVRPSVGPSLRLSSSGSLPQIATFWAGRSHEPVWVPWGAVGIVLGPSEDARYRWRVAFGGTIALARRSDLEVID